MNSQTRAYYDSVIREVIHHPAPSTSGLARPSRKLSDFPGWIIVSAFVFSLFFWILMAFCSYRALRDSTFLSRTNHTSKHYEK
jgi:hypothetical protein